MLIPLARGISVLMPNAPKFYPYCICMYIAGEQRAVIDFGAGQKAFNEIDIKSIELGFFTHNHPDHTHSAVLFHSSLYGQGRRACHTKVRKIILTTRI